MIHYTCDHCKREIGDDHQVRFVVKIEAYPEMSPSVADISSDDRDHLDEIQDLLEDLNSGGFAESDPAAVDGCVQQFDLCRDCYARFIRSPFGRDFAKSLHFSEN